VRGGGGEPQCKGEGAKEWLCATLSGKKEWGNYETVYPNEGGSRLGLDHL